jgi:large subunit ribosomal protein L32e
MVKNTQPLVKKHVVKKRTKTFVRFHSDRFMRVGESWRKSRGIDNRQRRRYKGTAPTPKIGFGSNKKTRNLLPNGFYNFRICKVADIELLLMHNQKYCAELASNLSSSKRMEIIKRAAQLGVRVTNANRKLTKEENA